MENLSPDVAQSVAQLKEAADMVNPEKPRPFPEADINQLENI